MNALVRLVVAAGLLLVAGCGAESADPAPSTSARPDSAGSEVPPPLVPAMPLPDDAVDRAVAQLDGLAEDLMDRSGIPGMAVAVVHGGKTVYAKGFGVKDIRTGEPVDADTVFQLASVSKSVTATVVAQQVGEKVVDWDTRIVEKLPWFALADPAVTQMVTVADMLSHRSGLPDHAGDTLEDLGYDRRHVLEKLRELPLSPFRITYEYTNFGFTAGAEAVAVAAGKPWETLAEDVLFKPLGMGATSFRLADFQARPNRAVGHINIDGRYEPRYLREPDAQSPAAGVSSSVNDMTRWLAMVLADGEHEGRRLIDPEALLPAVSPQIVASKPSEPAMRAGFYGYGFNVGVTSGARTEISHSGAFELGTGTNFVILPSADVAIIALTNATPSGVPETLTAQFADLVQFGEIREDWYNLYRPLFEEMEKPMGSLVGKEPPADPAPAAPLASYVGTYANDYWGPARVTERDGQLRLAMGTKLDVPLTHWDGNTFTFELITENAPPGTISTAVFDGNRLTLEYFDTFEKGTFVK
ncbi:penicillin-binding protein, beta-lactamase class C [Mycolicibacterium phlei]|jgi:CubicO group peptidase (beta-lactamase class C family)|uniref:Beta-lactamase n=1 Tax=Mycolicibacterium phlei DSM 43239 = CCUG 21000 TaxID=1226750 RepID=A0A5N5UYI3_MYCPH|nr:serine hydrolase [Mycolicibacterium phlei]VEG07794.1 penicillin-binding protein, beta-lactamase class C [Mycobacteroides chelonae]AMO59665.1 Esterase EstB [Mycolicibacterium phlei]KAB7753489.1 beta-lactamase [Mycolicibacterium phlei DSM 43239 = CCUG 21000]KXW62392.1 beta-lactamase [Mycolicibacterium phlei DSM 43239 = CCUG 21000]KXW69797.1 beta-lactamase [Mycolicibacterium phlei DSM 43072]